MTDHEEQLTDHEEQLALALIIASEAHDGQFREFSDTPYVEHCKRVAALAAECGLSLDAQVAAYLHDVVEDCEGWSLGRLLQRGISERAVQLVGLLTKPVPTNKVAYYDGILGDDEAVALKLLDRSDNLRDMVTLVPTNRSWTVAYYQKTKVEFPRIIEAARLAQQYHAVRRFGAALIALDYALTPTSIPAHR